MVKMLKKKTGLLSLTLLTMLIVSSVTVYAEGPSLENIDLLGLSEEEFDKLYVELLNEAEEDLARPKWLVRTLGYSWRIEPSVSDAIQPDECFRMSMRLIATRVYVTKCGYKLYRIEGTLTNDGKTIKVFGIAVLDRHGYFCMKLDSEEPIGFRLFGCGRIKADYGMILLRMKGRFELNGAHFGFIQKGYARRLLVASVNETA